MSNASRKTRRILPLLVLSSLVSFSCSSSIRVGKNVLIAAGVQVSDYDGHPIDAARRRAGEPKRAPI